MVTKYITWYTDFRNIVPFMSIRVDVFVVCIQELEQKVSADQN